MAGIVRWSVLELELEGRRWPVTSGQTGELRRKPVLALALLPRLEDLCIYNGKLCISISCGNTLAVANRSAVEDLPPLSALSLCFQR